MNEGNSSGRGIGCVSWDGEVHADQFWRNMSFGNVRERPFSEIWQDESNDLMAKLKDKKSFVKAGAPPAAGSMSVEETSAAGPKRYTGMYGPRIRPAI